MSSNPRTSDFQSLIVEAEKIADDASAAFGGLSPEQINWKRSAGEWSIGQCFDHLITANATYFSLLERIAAGENKRTLWQRVPLLPSLFGRLIIGAVSPESARKVKAPRAFTPTASEVDARIIDKFRRHQEELLRLMNATEKFEPEKIIIPSSVSPLIIYSLLDGYRILVTHERRHFLQAERVMKSEGFPRA